MQTAIEELEKIIVDFTIRFESIPNADFAHKPHLNKWSKKEILGHLIDSAHNNLRRFISAQYENTPKIIYDQNFWVQSNNYQQSKKEDLILLWKLLNERICVVLSTMSTVNAQKECNTGKDEVMLHSIAWIAEDYVKHLKHHLNQIFTSSFDIVYIS